MKKILITGANSFIGTSFEEYIKTFGDKYQVDTVDMIDGSWRDMDMSGYDAVFHVAGIAHQKETKENASLYYKVNRDLAVDVAQKAKKDGVGHFVFLSTMSVYGMNSGIITKDTQPNPKSNYGKAKLQAEEVLKTIADDKFVVAILRPPMVYGKGCKGNFQTVLKIVKKFPFFPKVKNQRSLIHIDNLCAFVKCAIDNEISGTYFPQNNDYVSTCEMAQVIAEEIGKKIYFSFLAGCFIVIFRPFMPMLQKAFGTLIYKDVAGESFSYCVVDNKESLKKSI